MSLSKVKSGQVRPSFGVPIVAIAFLACFFTGRAHALTVTIIPQSTDNGYAAPARMVQWTDASGNPRSALMIDQNSNNQGLPYTGYMRTYTYMVNGQTRTCTGQNTSDAGGGNLEFSGEGFIQNHGAYGDDS